MPTVQHDIIARRGVSERTVFAKFLEKMARSKRFELLTPRFVVWCSIQLSYERASRGTATGAEPTQFTGTAQGPRPEYCPTVQASDSTSR
jgi:hypothetical protein